MKRFVRFVSTLALALAGCHAGVTAQPAKTIAMLIAEPQYQTVKTLPVFAQQFLAPDYKVEYITGSTADGEVSFTNIDALAKADVLLVSVRRRTPPHEQMELIRKFVAAGKPVVGIRTASHAFKLQKGSPAAGHDQWPEWDQEVLGGNYAGHYPSGAAIAVNAPSASETLLAKVKLPFNSDGPLYRPSPLQPGTHLLLLGTLPGQAPEPVAWTFVHKDGGRTFYTSLGSPQDFASPSFQQLLLNGIRWAAGNLDGKGAR